MTLGPCSTDQAPQPTVRIGPITIRTLAEHSPITRRADFLDIFSLRRRQAPPTVQLAAAMGLQLAARDLPSDVPGRAAPERVRSHASARRRREEKILKNLASASDRRVFGE